MLKEKYEKYGWMSLKRSIYCITTIIVKYDSNKGTITPVIITRYWLLSTFEALWYAKDVALWVPFWCLATG